MVKYRDREPSVPERDCGSTWPWNVDQKLVTQSYHMATVGHDHCQESWAPHECLSKTRAKSARSELELPYCWIDA